MCALRGIVESRHTNTVPQGWYPAARRNPALAIRFVGREGGKDRRLAWRIIYKQTLSNIICSSVLIISTTRVQWCWQKISRRRQRPSWEAVEQWAVLRKVFLIVRLTFSYADDHFSFPDNIFFVRSLVKYNRVDDKFLVRWALFSLKSLTYFKVGKHGWGDLGAQGCPTWLLRWAIPLLSFPENITYVFLFSNLVWEWPTKVRLRHSTAENQSQKGGWVGLVLAKTSFGAKFWVGILTRQGHISQGSILFVIDGVSDWVTRQASDNR